MDKVLSSKVLRCHFCTRKSTEVKKMIAGNYAYICNECIAECVNILAGLKLDDGDSHDKS